MGTPRVVILAAGASRRLGQPKALVELPGGRPVTRLVAAARAAGDEHPLVVAGAHFAEIEVELRRALRASTPIEACHNLAWERGRTGSLVVAAERTGAVDLCVLPVDHPRIDSALLTALFAAWEEAGSPPLGWLAPGFRAAHPEDTQSPEATLRPGHPVVIGAQLVARLLADPETWSTRPLFELRQAATPLWMLPTRDVAVVENLDRPEDLEVIRARDMAARTAGRGTAP